MGYVLPRYLKDEIASTIDAVSGNDGGLGYAIPRDRHAVIILGKSTEGDGGGGLFADTDNGSSDTFLSKDGRTWYRVANLGVDQYDTVAAVEAATIPSIVDEIRTRRYSTSDMGYLGGATYVRVGSEPSHAGKIQSADGAWWELKTSFPIPQVFGAYSGAADHIDAVQACLEYANAKGVWAYFPGHFTYLVNMQEIPNGLRGIQGFGATWQAVSGVDDECMLGSYKYLNNVAEAQAPCDIRGITFNANDIAKQCVISQHWNSDIEDCEFHNAIRDGLKITAQTRDGTNFPSSSLVNNRIINNRFGDNGWRGLFILDPSRNKVTDYQVKGNYLYRNGSYAMRLDSSAGAWICDNETYNNRAGISINGIGRATIISRNHIDDGYGTTAADLPDGLSALPTGETHSYALYVQNNLTIGLVPVVDNTFLGPVTDAGSGSSEPYGLDLINNRYTINPSRGHTGYIHHSFFSAARELHSTNEYFESDEPFRWSNGSSTGRIVVTNARVKHLLPRKISGVLDGPTAINKIEHFMDPIGYGTGGVFGHKTNNVENGGAFSFDFEVPYIRDGNDRTGFMVLNTRANNNGTVRVSYVGLVSVHAKINGTNAWVVSIANVLYTAGQWTTAPAASVADNGDGTGTLTITGEPSDSDGWGQVGLIWL